MKSELWVTVMMVALAAAFLAHLMIILAMDSITIQEPTMILLWLEVAGLVIIIRMARQI